MLLVEIGSIAILGLCAALRFRAGTLPAFLREAALIGLAGWLAEDLCIRLFDFYGYAGGWTVRLDRVPLLIGVIWPFVILSARDVARALFGDSGWLPLQAGLLILFDAALVEPVAVSAGLWRWSEGALFGVPLIGLFGWGLFGALCLALLRWRAWTVPLLAPPIANALLSAAWWTSFKWGPRQEMPAAAPLVIAAAAGAIFLYASRRRRASLPFSIALPRAAAAVLFFFLAARHGSAPLWSYAAVLALPWLFVVRLRPDRDADASRPAALERA